MRARTSVLMLLLLAVLAVFGWWLLREDDSFGPSDSGGGIAADTRQQPRESSGDPSRQVDKAPKAAPGTPATPTETAPDDVTHSQSDSVADESKSPAYLVIEFEVVYRLGGVPWVPPVGFELNWNTGMSDLFPHDDWSVGLLDPGARDREKSEREESLRDGSLTAEEFRELDLAVDSPRGLLPRIDAPTSGVSLESRDSPSGKGQLVVSTWFEMSADGVLPTLETWLSGPPTAGSTATLSDGWWFYSDDDHQEGESHELQYPLTFSGLGRDGDGDLVARFEPVVIEWESLLGAGVLWAQGRIVDPGSKHGVWIPDDIALAVAIAAVAPEESRHEGKSPRSNSRVSFHADGRFVFAAATGDLGLGDAGLTDASALQWRLEYFRPGSEDSGNAHRTDCFVLPRPIRTAFLLDFGDVEFQGPVATIKVDRDPGSWPSGGPGPDSDILACVEVEVLDGQDGEALSYSSASARLSNWSPELLVGMTHRVSVLDVSAHVDADSNYDLSAMPGEVRNSDPARRIVLRPGWRGTRKVRVMVEGKDAPDARLGWRQIYDETEKEEMRTKYLDLRSVSPPVAELSWDTMPPTTLPLGNLADNVLGEYYFGVAPGYLPEAVWVPRDATGDVEIILSRKPMILTLTIELPGLGERESSLVRQAGYWPDSLSVFVNVWTRIHTGTDEIKNVGVTHLELLQGRKAEVTVAVDPALDLCFVAIPARIHADSDESYPDHDVSFMWSLGQFASHHWNAAGTPGVKLDLGMLPMPLVERRDSYRWTGATYDRLTRTFNGRTYLSVDSVPGDGVVQRVGPSPWPYRSYRHEFPVTGVMDAKSVIPADISFALRRDHGFPRLNIKARLTVALGGQGEIDSDYVVRLIHPESGHWTMRQDLSSEVFRLWSPRGQARLEVYATSMPVDAPKDALPVPIFTQDVFISDNATPQHVIVTLPKPDGD